MKKENIATEEEKKKYGDSKEKAISLKRWKGFFRRFKPNKHNIKELGKRWSIKLWGLHTRNYVFVVIIGANGIETPYLIPYNELVILNNRCYNLKEEFRTIGDYGISTWYFNHSSVSPINMTKSDLTLSSTHYREMVKKMQLSAITTQKIMKGSRQFPAISLPIGIAIVLAIWFIYYWYTQARFF